MFNRNPVVKAIGIVAGGFAAVVVDFVCVGSGLAIEKRLREKLVSFRFAEGRTVGRGCGDVQFSVKRKRPANFAIVDEVA